MKLNETHILRWGRFDEGYSRNRILHQCLRARSCKVDNFKPRLSRWGDLEAFLRYVDDVDLIWVPCFRQRDLKAAVRWGRKKRIPVVFDPLISAFDKQVFERKKFTADSRKGKKLLAWESALFQSVDLVIADTCEHALFFQETLGVDPHKLAVVPVGAEEELFRPSEQKCADDSVPTVLFYGSFLNLQGPVTIVEAARRYSGPPVKWKMVGDGPLLEECRISAKGLSNIEFLPWMPYEDLPKIICQADILLGVFGTSAKAGRVIPNKVYQALACGKPLITSRSSAYPELFHNNDVLGIGWVDSGNSQQLADKVAKLLSDRIGLVEMGTQARQSYETYFSMEMISASLFAALRSLLP
ncbi:glycosyltransferase [Deltaproteobacteria bacterium]|nr:glycosyltransferase [Deltaproteobacteria bacterium]